MKPRIIEYRKTRDLVAAFRRGEVMEPGSLTITAMGPVARAIREVDGRRFSAINVIAAQDIIQEMLKRWYSVTTKLQQFINLGKLIGGFEKDVRHSLFNSRGDIIQSIKIMTEIGISPEMLAQYADNSEDIATFCRLYTDFWEIDGSCRWFEDQIKSWEDKEILLKEMGKAIAKRAKVDSVDLHTVKRIYLQGFFYFTTTQELLLRALLRLDDVEIVFLNNMERMEGEAEVPYTIWEKNRFFSGVSRTVLREVDKEETKGSEIFIGEELCSERKARLEKGLAIKKYPDVFSFVSDMQREGRFKEKHIYTPQGDDIEEIMETFFPDSLEKKHILAYPVGQYLMLLYQMWNREEDSLCPEIDLLSQCVATGWAADTPQKTGMCMQALERVAFYFEDCHTLDEWNERWGLLESVYCQVLPQFDYMPGKERPNERWHRMLENPLHHVGAFSLEQDEFDVLREVVQNVIGDAKRLFMQSQSAASISLEVHFCELKSLLESKDAFQRMALDEKEALDCVMERLLAPFVSWKGMDCRAADLAEAMKMFLGGKLEQGSDEDSAVDAISLPLLQDRKVVPQKLFTVEAQLFCKRKQPAIVCFCDDRHIPGASQPYPWPLNRDTMVSLAAAIAHTRARGNISCWKEIHGRLNDYIANKENMKLSNRYVFFLAMQLSDIELNWIEEMDNQQFSPSPYIYILEKISDKKAKPFSENDQVGDRKTLSRDEHPYEQSKFVPSDITCEELPREVVLNDRYCPYRNLYDYGLMQMPCFTDVFRLQHFVPRLASVIEWKLRNRNDAKKIFRWFPMWNEVEREEKQRYMSSFDDAMDGSYEKESFDGYTYGASRLFLKYIGPKDFETLKKEDPAEEPAYYRCMYCPHIGSCYYEVREEVEADV